MENRLPSFLWLSIPLVAFIIQIILELSFSNELLSKLHSEWGAHETLQFLVIAAAFVVAVLCLTRFQWARNKFKAAWFGIAALACFYIAGEEISWGQHIFEWSTSEKWAALNDQGETNLHNMSSWLDQKPRLLLLFGVVVGGIILPFLKTPLYQKIPAVIRLLIPPKQFLLISLIVIVPHIFEKIMNSFDISIFVRFSEVQELFMFYFVLLYLVNSFKSLSKS